MIKCTCIYSENMHSSPGSEWKSSCDAIYGSDRQLVQCNYPESKHFAFNHHKVDDFAEIWLRFDTFLIKVKLAVDQTQKSELTNKQNLVPSLTTYFARSGRSWQFGPKIIIVIIWDENGRQFGPKMMIMANYSVYCETIREKKLQARFNSGQNGYYSQHLIVKAAEISSKRHLL